MREFGFFGILVNPICEKYACFARWTYSSFAVGEVDNALCFDGVGGLHGLLVLHLGKCGVLWYDVEFQELIRADTIAVDVEIDALVAICEFLESQTDGFFCFGS